MFIFSLTVLAVLVTIYACNQAYKQYLIELKQQEQRRVIKETLHKLQLEARKKIVKRDV